MPILFDTLYADTDDMTTFVRNVPAPPTFRFLNEFPRTESEDNTINWSEITRTNRTARYRSFDGSVHVSRRDGGETKTVKMLPLGTSLSKGELESLMLEFKRNGGTRYELLAKAAYNDAENLTREVQARLEQAWGDVLTDGKLTINENGFQGEADYGVPANQIVAAATAWTNAATAPILTNIRDWNDVYIANNGTGAGQIVTSQVRIRDILKNKEVIDALYGTAAGRTRATVAELNTLLGDEGLPILTPAYDSLVDVDGVSTRTVPADKVLLLPTDLSELGHTAYGVTATAIKLVDSEESDMSFEEAPGIVGVIFAEDGVPYREYTYVDAVAMPVLTNARKLLIADVA